MLHLMFFNLSADGTRYITAIEHREKCEGGSRVVSTEAHEATFPRGAKGAADVCAYTLAFNIANNIKPAKYVVSK